MSLFEPTSAGLVPELAQRLEHGLLLVWMDGPQIDGQSIVDDTGDDRHRVVPQPFLDHWRRESAGMDGDKGGWKLGLRR